MSFPCSHRNCTRSFRSQDAADQHYFSFHNKEAYDAQIRASQIANKERKKREDEEARMRAALGDSPPEDQNDRLGLRERISQKDSYYETPKLNGQPLDSAPISVAKKNRASEMGPPPRVTPLTFSNLEEHHNLRTSTTPWSSPLEPKPPPTTASKMSSSEYETYPYGSEYHSEPLPCPDCSFLFRDQGSLDYHISTKHQPPPCFVCRKSFPNDQTIDEHLETVPHECIYCNIPLPSRKAGIESHMWFAHPFICRECGLGLPNSATLSRHMSTVHRNGIWCQACQPPCGRSFETQEALNGHIKSVLPEHSIAPARRSDYTYPEVTPWESISQDQDNRRRARDESSSMPGNSRSRRSGARRDGGSSGSKNSSFLPLRRKEEGTSVSTAKNSSFLPLRRKEEVPSVAKNSSIIPKRHDEKGKFELGSPPPERSTRRRRKNSSVAESSSGSTTHHTEISSSSGRLPAVVSSDENRFRCNCGSNTCIMSCEGPPRTQTDPVPPIPQKHTSDSPAQPVIQSVQPVQPVQPVWLSSSPTGSPKKLSYPCFSCHPFCGNVFATQKAKDAHIKSLSSGRKSSKLLDTNNSYSGSLGITEKHSELLSTNEKSSTPNTKYNKTLFFCQRGDPGCEEIFETPEALLAHTKQVTHLEVQTLEKDSRSVNQATPTRHSELLDTNEKLSNPTTRCIRTLFLCESCDPACNKIFETRQALSAHIEQEVHHEIQSLEEDIWSTKQTAKTRIEALEKQLEAMKETHRLEIETMSINLEFIRGKIPDINTKILPSFACGLCKPFCGNIFNTEVAIEKHLDAVLDNAMDTRLKSSKAKDAVHSRKAKFPMKCYTCTPSCGTTFDSIEGLNQHLDLMIEKSQLLITQYYKQQFPCDECDPSCGNVFHYKEDLEAHLKHAVEAVEAVEITEPQEVPNTDFESEVGLLVDLESPTSHDESMQDFQRIFDSYSERKRRVAELSILDIVDQFSCGTCNPECGRIFNSEEELQNHQRFVEERSLRRNTSSEPGQWIWLIIETPETIESLSSMIHKQDVLLEYGFFEAPERFSHEKKIKCINCHGVKSELDLEDTTCTYHPGKWGKDGEIRSNRPDCCKKRIKGCIVSEKHSFISFGNSEKPAFQATPAPSFFQQKRKAVVLGCGVGISAQTTGELIQLIAIDFFTGEILIDMIVRPRKKIVNYRTRWTGVTEEIVQKAIAAGEFLDSVESARSELFKWVDSQTILIGHSLNVDLWLLQLRHHLVIDSFLALQQNDARVKKSERKKKPRFRNVPEDPIQTLRNVRELIIRLSGSGTALLADKSPDYEGGFENKEDTEISYFLLVLWISWWFLFFFFNVIV